MALALVAASQSVAQRVDRVAELAFDAGIKAEDQIGWINRLASAPNHVGSPHNRANAEFLLARFREWGWEARIETFDVLYPTPISTRIERISPDPLVLGGQEPAMAGDVGAPDPATTLPPYVAYQGDGDVTADLVYVNYGLPEDYAALARRGIDVRGKIVIARYGGGWRGLKPKLAQEHGGIGCLIYSDPADDGYARGAVYPDGGGRPEGGVQRGSVSDVTVYPGDPLTPGIASVPGAPRLARAGAATIMKIPTLPISYGDARQLLSRLGGPVAPAAWRGALPITYRMGGTGGVTVRLAVSSDWATQPVHNVIAVLRGSHRPDEWVIRGNHFDAWNFGAWDPMSGLAAMLSEAKSLGALAKAGRRPLRTIVYTAWDGEEPGMLGSTHFLGLATLSIGFGGEFDGGIYHSVYDNPRQFTTYTDPGLQYGVALSQIVGRLVMRVANAETPPLRFADVAMGLAGALAEIERLVDQRRADDGRRSQLLSDGVFRLASDPRDPVAAPAGLPMTPPIQFLALKEAIERLRSAAIAYDAAHAARGATLAAGQVEALNAQLRDVEQLLLDDRGLPGRPWYRNLVAAPGRYTGYAAKTLPGVREAIEERRFADADVYVERTAAVIAAYADRLEAARRTLGGSAPAR